MDWLADLSSQNWPVWHLLDGCVSTRNRKGYEGYMDGWPVRRWLPYWWLQKSGELSLI